MNILQPNELDKLKAEHPNVKVIDVRGYDEAELNGLILGAEVMPLQAIPQWAGQLDKTQPYVMVCRAGVRSAQACEYLASLGFEHLYNLEGGMSAWMGEVTHQLPA